jgi:hypothetical protein
LIFQILNFLKRLRSDFKQVFVMSLKRGKSARRNMEIVWMLSACRSSGGCGRCWRWRGLRWEMNTLGIGGAATRRIASRAASKTPGDEPGFTLGEIAVLVILAEQAPRRRA